MAKKYTTDDLLNSIKSRMLIPTNQETFTNDQILMLADEELQNFIVPMLMDVREDYLVAKKNQSVAGVTSPNRPVFRIPERAIGNKLTDLTVIASSSTNDERSIPHYSRPDSHDSLYAYNYDSPSDGFTFEGNKIIILGDYGSGASFNLYYAQRPNKLIATGDAGQITAINTSSNEITVSSLPSTFAVGEEIDLIMAKAPYDNLAIDVTISSISGTTIGLPSLPTNSSTGTINLSVGDYIALAGEAPVVQVPTELFPVLAQATVIRILEALGDVNGSQLARESLIRTSQDVIAVISPRVEGERKIVLARNNIFNYLSRRTPWRF